MKRVRFCFKIIFILNISNFVFLSYYRFILKIKMYHTLPYSKKKKLTNLLEILNNCYRIIPELKISLKLCFRFQRKMCFNIILYYIFKHYFWELLITCSDKNFESCRSQRCVHYSFTIMMTSEIKINKRFPF